MSAGQDSYRNRWSWDRVTFGTHCLNCLATCPYRVYSKDGDILFEEPAGVFEQVNPDVPDMNPMSCQKGSAWSQQITGPDRLLYPLRRAGERGEDGEVDQVSGAADQAELEQLEPAVGAARSRAYPVCEFARRAHIGTEPRTHSA